MPLTHDLVTEAAVALDYESYIREPDGSVLTQSSAQDTVLHLCRMLELAPGLRVLAVGTGSGYHHGRPIPRDVQAGGFIEIHPEAITEVAVPIRYRDGLCQLTGGEAVWINAPTLRDSPQRARRAAQLIAAGHSVPSPLDGDYAAYRAFCGYLYARQPPGLASAGFARLGPASTWGIGLVRTDSAVVLRPGDMYIAGTEEAEESLRALIQEWTYARQPDRATTADPHPQFGGFPHRGTSRGAKPGSIACMLVAGRLDIPEGITALLFDLDGVLLDSLSLDYEIVRELLQEELNSAVEVPQSVIRENFPLALPDFWRKISDTCALGLTPNVVARLVDKHESRRRVATIATHNGIPEIIEAARSQGIPIGVVSNNPHCEIRAILAGAGIVADVIVGNDEPGLRRKPAPDTYRDAATRLGRPPSACLAVEDSLLGTEAAGTAGCYTVAVATGANSFRELSESPYVSRCYTSFDTCYVSLGRAGVMSKTLSSPNDFVSHMIEHVAWRLGCSIDLSWTHDGWRELGFALGREVRKLPIRQEAASTLGMIDDGSAEIHVRATRSGGAVLTASRQVDLEWFLRSRAEQLPNGKPLVEVLKGLGAGGGLDLTIIVASFEDPHHTWEGIFRGVGIALDAMVNEQPVAPDPLGEEGTHVPAESRPTGGQGSTERAVERGWTVQRVSAWGASLHRRTAESDAAVSVRLGAPSVHCTINVARSIDVTGVVDLLAAFADGAALQLDVRYDAIRLSSSHVVTEDIGMTLGRALRYVAIERMERFGIQGSGSNIKVPNEDTHQPIRVGVSMEGRKFWKYVPMSQDYGDFRKAFLVGHTLANGLYSEDLDDFIDGLAGGLEASIVMHIDNATDPVTGWPMLFRGLGEAMAGLLAVNPHRLSLAPGVKATLA